MLTKFNEQSQKVIVIAESIAFDLGHMSVGSEHLLLSLLKSSDIKLKKVLSHYDVKEEIIREDVIRLFGTSEEQPFYMEYSDVVKDILENAILIAKERKIDKVTVNILCIALLEMKESVGVELLKKYNVDIEDVIFQIKENSELESKLDQVPSLTNLNKKVKNNPVNIIGREKEIEQLCTILSKKEKSNAIIIGEAGVGKSALVEKLAIQINAKEVPKKLQKTLIYELSLSGIVAGTKYRGEFEEKLNKLINKIKGIPNVVLFIDEIHNLIGAGGAEGAIDAANILKPYLARKDITIIGATTTEEYYKYFEKEQAMNRRFSVITLKENTKEETLDILKNIKCFYEKYHGLNIDNDVLVYLVNIVDKKMKQRTFPDKAIDILDLSCVKATFSNILLTTDLVKEVVEDFLNSKFDVALDTKMIKEKMKDRIKGQDNVIDEVLSLIQNKKSSVQPDGVFLFTGSSGIGKTALSKELAIQLDRPIIRLDMTEYRDSTSVQKIIGAPPGYIGYEKPSMFLTKINNNPKCIILMDEIEKCHSDVRNILLQVFDEGYLEDNMKRKIYFNDCIIIMTANISNTVHSMGFKKQCIDKSVNQYFTDEFMNRVDGLMKFKPIGKEDVKLIIQNETDNALSSIQIDKLLEDYVPSQGVRAILKKAMLLLNKQKQM